MRELKKGYKIAIFTSYYLPHTGGVERYTYNIAKKLSEKGNKVFIVTCRYDKNLKEIEKTEYATIYRLPTFSICANRYPILKFNKAQKSILNLIKKENIDFIILQTRFWLTSLVGARFAKKQNIPNILIEHGSSHLTVNNAVLDFFGRIYEHAITACVKKFVNDFYAVSNSAKKWMKHFNIDASGVLYNAIDIDDYNRYKENMYDFDNKVPEGYLCIVYVGRMLKEKGILELIQAYKKLSKIYKIKLVLVGDGPFMKELQEEKSDIILTGNLSHDDVMKIYQACDIFVNPSYTEGLPTTILEVGLMKKPIVATNVGGTPEIIEDKKEGLLCKPTEEDIEAKLEEMIKNKELREKCAENVHRKVIREFSWEETTNKILNIINNRE